MGQKYPPPQQKSQGLLWKKEAISVICQKNIFA